MRKLFSSRTSKEVTKDDFKALLIDNKNKDIWYVVQTFIIKYNTFLLYISNDAPNSIPFIHNFRPQLMDVFGASRNVLAHEAVMEMFGNPTQTKRPDLCERYLWALSQSENCPPKVAKGQYFCV